MARLGVTLGVSRTRIINGDYLLFRILTYFSHPHPDEVSIPHPTPYPTGGGGEGGDAKSSGILKLDWALPSEVDKKKKETLPLERANFPFVFPTVVNLSRHFCRGNRSRQCCPVAYLPWGTSGGDRDPGRLIGAEGLWAEGLWAEGSRVCFPLAVPGDVAV